jgi:hypothetical protein
LEQDTKRRSAHFPHFPQTLIELMSFDPRQQVDKDRRTAKQRDELAPFYVEHGASSPIREPRRQQ